LKPALARGELHAIGATTLKEYQKYIERDGALGAQISAGSCFRAVRLTTRVAFCAAFKEKYEIHHGVRITDAAILAAANLSSRYITDRFLPDKAVT